MTTKALRAEMDPDYVEVKVCAVSLNFCDVLNVLGMYPGDPDNPWCEFSGVIRRVGASVSSYSYIVYLVSTIAFYYV